MFSIENNIYKDMFILYGFVVLYHLSHITYVICNIFILYHIKCGNDKRYIEYH